MKEITVGNKTVRVRATPLALLFYKQEFNADILADLIKLSEMADDVSKIDTITLLQIIWAMNKADNYGKQFPSFEKWLEQFEYIDFSDEGFILDAITEAQEGFFRGGGGGPK